MSLSRLAWLTSFVAKRLIKANDLKKILTRVKAELELSVKAMTKAEIVLATKQSNCHANRAILLSELDGLRCEAELREEAHVEALQNMRDESEVDLAEHCDALKKASKLKYSKGHDRGYIIGYTNQDHCDN